MLKTFTAPNRYIQGYGVITDIGKQIAHLGSRPFIICGKTALSIIREPVSISISENGMKCAFEEYRGKGTRADASDLASKAAEFGADIIVGAGGGLVLDTAKAVVYEMDLPLVTVPTIASNDAPCSAESLQYFDDHQLDRIIVLKRNPDVILVDSKIISEAPTRFFVAGMGDAVATWFEAHTCSKTGVSNFSGGLATETGLTIARLAYDILMEHGAAAKLAVDKNVVTPAVEMVIEANILLSGMGFENCGIGAAHSISIGLSVLKGAEKCLHGELVGFGVIANLVLENYPKEETQNVVELFRDVELPITLQQLGLGEPSIEELMQAARASSSTGTALENLPFEVTPELVLGAIVVANELGSKAIEGSL